MSPAVPPHQLSIPSRASWRRSLPRSTPTWPAASSRSALTSVAAIRLEAIDQRRQFLAELERLKELERAGRVLAAREERQAEADEQEELATWREQLRAGRVD
jgi:hypothetical protein